MFQFYNAWTLNGLDLVVTESTSDNFSNAYSFLFHVCRYIAFVLVYALIGKGLHSWELPHTSVYYRHGTNGCYMEQLHNLSNPPQPSPTPQSQYTTSHPLTNTSIARTLICVLYITGRYAFPFSPAPKPDLHTCATQRRLLLVLFLLKLHFTNFLGMANPQLNNPPHPLDPPASSHPSNSVMPTAPEGGTGSGKDQPKTSPVTLSPLGKWWRIQRQRQRQPSNSVSRLDWLKV